MMMESGVEARDLRQLRETVVKRLDQANLFRQMFRIERAELMQLFDQIRRDALRLPILWPAMNDAMANARQRAAFNSCIYPIHQQIHRRGGIGRGNTFVKTVRWIRALYLEGAFAKTDALDSSQENTPRNVGGFEQREQIGRASSRERV